MSFEWYGGFLALKELAGWGAEKEMAESVAEAVIRHQDIGEVGSITFLGAMLQLATVFDNMGWNKEIVDWGIVEEVVAGELSDEFGILLCFLFGVGGGRRLGSEI